MSAGRSPSVCWPEETASWWSTVTTRRWAGQWARPAARRVIPVVGDAADEAITGRAADLAQGAGSLARWVNDAAIFRDAWLDAVPARAVTGLIVANLSLAVTGCATAIRRFLAAGAGGAIVNVSSQQAQRAVRGPRPMPRPRPQSRA